jgi:hypothetical protein
MIDQTTNGPWSFVKVPAGNYKVSVSYGDRTVAQDFKLGNGLQTHVIYW